jgi:hypothetical protein
VYTPIVDIDLFYIFASSITTKTTKNNNTMSYISTQQVKEIRTELKALFPKTKFSICREHYSGVRIEILKSDVNFETSYNQVNTYYIAEHFEGAQREMLLKIYEIASRGTTWFETGDYGTQPSHYVWMTIGAYDKNFQHIN